jgi:hypothetical protein
MISKPYAHQSKSFCCALAHNISLMTQAFSSVSFMCISTSISVFGEISHPGDKKESPCNRYNCFFWKRNGAFSPHYEEFFFGFTMFRQ